MPVRAELQPTAYEYFDYSSGFLLNATAAEANRGWFSGWKADAALTSALDSSYAISANGDVTRTTSLTMYRGLADPIVMTQNLTHYFSYRIKITGTPSTSEYTRAVLQLDGSNYFGVRNKASGSTPLQWIMRFNNQAVTNASLPDVVPGDTYTVVVKIVAAQSGIKRAFMKVYGPSDPIGQEPAGGGDIWDMVSEQYISTTFNALGFYGNLYTSAAITVDNLTYGLSWQDVVPHPTLLAHERFNYPAATLLNTTAADSYQGWSSGWKSDLALTTALDSSFAVTAAHTVERANTLELYRGLPASINTGITKDYYFSWKVSISGTLAASQYVRALLYFSNTTFAGLQAVDDSSLTMQLVARYNGTEQRGAVVAVNQLNTLVMKLSCNASGNDTMALKLYGPDDPIEAEPTTWDLTVSATGSLTFSAIGLYNRAYLATNNITIDELYYGESWLDVTEAEAEVLGRQLFSHIDLTNPTMSTVNSCLGADDYPGALAAFRDQFVDRLEELDTPPREEWLFGANTASDLLNNDVRMRYYDGVSQTQTEENIGAPGSIDWFIVPDDGNTDWAVYTSTLHFLFPLTDEYESTLNSVYIDKWVAVWDDFARNNYDGWQQLMGTSASADYGYLGNMWQARLFLAFRSANFFSQLSQAAKASPSGVKVALPPLTLARILNLLIEKDLNLLPSKLTGVPNQVLIASTSLVQASLLLEEFKNAATWYDAGEVGILGYVAGAGPYLEDGSDLEQSFNYNIYLVDTAIKLDLMHPTPPAWVDDIAFFAQDRIRFLASMVRPNAMLPGISQQYDRNAFYYPLDIWQLNPAFDDDLVTIIRDHLMGSGTEPMPEFKSITFPFGGFSVLRSGWGENDYHLFMKTSRRGSGHLDESDNQIQVTAYGKTMLIDSGPNSYNATPTVHDEYLSSSFSHNTISVDGYSQIMQEVEPVTSAYTTPLPNRWHTSSNFGFTEGTYDYDYGIQKTFDPEASPRVMVTDVTHARQVLYLQDPGVYIINDRLESSGTHTYSQSWNFDPSYAEGDVTYSAPSQWIKSAAATGPNIAIYHAGEPMMTYEQYYADTTPVRGWFRPNYFDAIIEKVDVDASWEGTGDQMLVTVLKPTNGATDVLVSFSASTSNGVTSVNAMSYTGRKIYYRAAQDKDSLMTVNLPSYSTTIDVEGEMLEVTDFPGGAVRGVVLGKTSFEINGVAPAAVSGLTNFEFYIRDSVIRSVTEITVPTGFAWTGTGEDVTPDYDP
jgi:hypothetical protein